jgi:signal transduction histidine kinase
MKNMFFSIVAHDMKEVLSTLVSLSNFLVMSVPGNGSNKLQRAAKMLESSVQNAIKLLENLLNWAKIQNGTMESHQEMTDLQKIVLENIVLLRGNAREKQIDLSHTVNANTFVYTDPDTTSMVLRNLISNALWFTNTGGKVKVSATSADRFVEVAVSDTGIGISQEDLSKLFRIDKKFRRNGTAGEHGTGLGLILCKDLIEMNGGQIWVESQVGKGSTFTFTLPREKI